MVHESIYKRQRCKPIVSRVRLPLQIQLRLQKWRRRPWQTFSPQRRWILQKGKQARARARIFFVKIFLIHNLQQRAKRSSGIKSCMLVWYLPNILMHPHTVPFHFHFQFCFSVLQMANIPGVEYEYILSRVSTVDTIKLSYLQASVLCSCRSTFLNLGKGSGTLFKPWWDWGHNLLSIAICLYH